MAKSRREFLTHASLGVAGAIVGVGGEVVAESQPPTQEPTPGAPPAFGTGPAVGPEVSPTTFAEAEKLVQVQLSNAERAEAAASWRVNLASLYERRTGARKVTLDAPVAPWSGYKSVLPGQQAGPRRDQFVRSATDVGAVPADDADIAYAPVTQLSRWIEQRKLSSERLTEIYLRRLERFDSELRCVITLTREPPPAQARKAE